MSEKIERLVALANDQSTTEAERAAATKILLKLMPQHLEQFKALEKLVEGQRERIAELESQGGSGGIDLTAQVAEALQSDKWKEVKGQLSALEQLLAGVNRR